MKIKITAALLLLLNAMVLFGQEDGSLKESKIRENGKSKDYFMTGPLHVIGKMGIGQNMSGSYEFGSSTFVMMQNNLRVEFDDSSTPSFPDNDWQIEINSPLDYASGGTNYFKIRDLTANTSPFTLTNGENDFSLSLGSNGNVGINTDNPLTKLQIDSKDSPAFMLSSGIKNMKVFGHELRFIIGQSSASPILRVDIDSHSNTLVLKSNGNVGIGTASPEHKLEVNGDAIIVECFYLGDESTDGSWRIINTNGNLLFEKRINGEWDERLMFE